MCTLQKRSALLLIIIFSVVTMESTYANCKSSEMALQGYVTDHNEDIIIFIANDNEHTKYEISKSTIKQIMQVFLINRMARDM